jgi:hypothetical protein
VFNSFGSILKISVPPNKLGRPWCLSSLQRNRNYLVLESNRNHQIFKLPEHKYILLSTALFCCSLLMILLNYHVLRERNKLIQYTRPSRDPPSQGISRGMEETGKIRQIEVTANSLFYCNGVTWYSTRTHTFTSWPLPWYSRNIRVGKVFLSFFNHALPKIKKSGQYHLTSRSSLIG